MAVGTIRLTTKALSQDQQRGHTVQVVLPAMRGG